jgi:hypothetical protein
MDAVQDPVDDRLATLAGLRDKYVRTDRDALFRSHLDRLLKRGADGTLLPDPVTFTATGETRGIALVEEAGGGKTSLVYHVLNTHPALQSDDPRIDRWIKVEVPSPATLKSLGLEILRKTGYPEVSSSRRQWDIWRLVRRNRGPPRSLPARYLDRAGPDRRRQPRRPAPARRDLRRPLRADRPERGGADRQAPLRPAGRACVGRVPVAPRDGLLPGLSPRG